MRGKISIKLWLIIVSLITITLILLGIFLFSFLEDFYLNIQVQSMIEQGRKIEGIITSETSPENLSHQLDIISDFIDGHIMVTDRSGTVCACNYGMMHLGGRFEGDNELKEVMEGNVVIRKGKNFGFEKSMLMVAVPYEERGEIAGAIVLFRPVDPITATVDSFKRIIVLTALGAIIISTVLSFFVSGKIVRPLVKMNRVAQKVAGGDFSERVAVETNDEVGDLAGTFNLMSEKLQRYISALSHEKEQLENILKSLNDGVITFGDNGEIIHINPQAERFLGTDIENLPFREKINNLITAALDERILKQDQIEHNKRALALTAVPLKRMKGERGVVLVLQDITHKKKAEELRRQFLSSVSHELRTPLSLLKGYAEALVDGMASNKEEEKEYLRVISDETELLNRIVNDLSDLNAMESGKLTLNKSKFDLREVAGGIIRMFKPAAEKQDISLRFEVEDKEIPLYYGDRGRIEQVLVNLVSNAVSYTPQGGEVIIKVSYENGNFIIQVRDNGQGIPPEELPYIWDRFYRVEKSRDRKTGGSGLGLAVVKSLVEAHGGRAEVSSEVGKGSTFTVILPQQQE